MNTEIILEIIKIVGYIILGGIALYLNTKSSLKEKASGYIAEAEEAYKDATNAGGIKFEYVVDKLYSIIPTALKVFFTRDMLSAIVQKAFDAVEAYAKTQLDKASASLPAITQAEASTEAASTEELSNG